LKIPQGACSTRRKPKNPKRLNPHGKCLTLEEFTLNRLKPQKKKRTVFMRNRKKRRKEQMLPRPKKMQKFNNNFRKSWLWKSKRQ